ncbi:MAG: hypothetical protein JNK97_03535 [Zoogloea sp.]|nr:hypothetical protein [Zoogloea sp.]
MTGVMYFFGQATSTSAWKCHPSTERDRVLHEEAPALVTVLDVDNSFDRDLTAEEYKAVKYLGPWYADFDGEIEAAIGAFKALLGKLQALGLELGACRLYATGGRGFHVEVPPECFVPAGLPAGGVAGLPHVYREMAHELFVDLMDMRVYSAKRGRMWRCPNRRRDNGKFKVPLTVSEAMSMTVEKYDEVCAAPRAFPALVAPEFCPALGQLYIRARDKVQAHLRKRRRAPDKVREVLQKRFTVRGYALPTSLLALAHGHVPAREGAGWNQICLQIVSTAHAIGLDVEALVLECRPLIEGHCGDGVRYRTPKLREDELRKTFDYLDGGLYDFTTGGLKSILPKSLPCLDLEGL